MDTNDKKATEEKQDIDIVALVRYLWTKRGLLLKCCCMALVAGLIIAFSIPREYRTTVILMPETNNTANKMGNLGGLAAMAGLDLSNTAGLDAISPDLYPDVVRSTPFLVELFSQPVSSKRKDISCSLYDYLKEHQRHAWWNYIARAPMEGVSWVAGLFAAPEEKTDKIDPFSLTREQERVLKELQDKISVYVDKKTQTVTISAQMQDPLISAQVADNIVKMLQSYITDYRTQKARQDLEFTEKVLKEARAAYYKAQQTYATFEDGNKNIISSSYRTEQERLKNEMTLTFNVYNTLAQKLEQDKLRVQEQTPVYTIIEPATVPLKAYSPNKPLILIGCLFLTFVTVAGYLLIKDRQLF